jgi:hypothetical protein
MQNVDDILASAAAAQLDEGRDRYLGSGSHLRGIPQQLLLPRWNGAAERICAFFVPVEQH